jgi:hypothetical protein
MTTETPERSPLPPVNPAVAAAEAEASRALAAEAAPDNPNPPAADAPPAPQPATEAPAPDAPKPLERVTSFDRGRADIAARFKEKRAAQGGQVEFHGNFQDPSQTYGPYAGQGAPAEPEPGAAPTETPAPSAPAAETATPAAASAPAPEAPRLVKVKVHGVEMHIPEDQVIAEAQKSLAAGNLLETAKDVLALSRQPAQPPDGPDPYVELAQTIQLEDAAAAGTKLKQTIEGETAKARQEAAREAARQVRLETELSASQKAMAAFEKTHPELAADEFARDAVTTQVQREINADLQAVVAQGILKELPRSQDERNGLHTQLRAFGAPVRPMTDIFNAAGTKYATWRGGTPAPRSAPQPAPATTSTQPAAQAAPRVELSPDRAQRRAAIPTQPTNGTVPPRAPALSPEQTTAQRRSAAVMAMRKARGQITA